MVRDVFTQGSVAGLHGNMGIGHRTIPQLWMYRSCQYDIRPLEALQTPKHNLSTSTLPMELSLVTYSSFTNESDPRMEI